MPQESKTKQQWLDISHSLVGTPVEKEGQLQIIVAILLDIRELLVTLKVS